MPPHRAPLPHRVELDDAHIRLFIHEGRRVIEPLNGGPHRLPLPPRRHSCGRARRFHAIKPIGCLVVQFVHPILFGGAFCVLAGVLPPIIRLFHKAQVARGHTAAVKFSQAFFEQREKILLPGNILHALPVVRLHVLHGVAAHPFRHALEGVIRLDQPPHLIIVFQHFFCRQRQGAILRLQGLLCPAPTQRQQQTARYRQSRRTSDPFHIQPSSFSV